MSTVKTRPLSVSADEAQTVGLSEKPSLDKTFRIVLIKPSHYDDNGYVIRWRWSSVPSNSLASLYSISAQVRASGHLGRDMDIPIDVYDETNQKIPVKKIIRQLKASGTRGVVFMVGVQTNQFSRAGDLARPFCAAGISVAIGGFHVSGCLSMLDKIPDDIQKAMTDGITMVAGEVEETLGEVLQDALEGQMKPLYNFLKDLPPLEDQALPILPQKIISRYVGSLATFDSGRGCPFSCSFCTIINVQGQKSRYRTADDIEKIIRENYKQGIHRYFITDDDFARNKNWEAIFDRIILLRKRDKIKISFMLQVDTACHRNPRFIEKAGKAGCSKVFLGIETVNPEALKSTSKNQNRVHEYKAMLEAWRKWKVVTVGGYIIGFPTDTYESVMRDIEFLKTLPLDLAEFFMLTPLPGSQDHKMLVQQGAWLEPDMNIYDQEHACSKHPLMSTEEWMRTYRDAWDVFYSPEHIETLFKRRQADRSSSGKLLGQILWFIGSIRIENIHPLQSGIIRQQSRSERRPTFPKENPLTFSLRRLWHTTISLVGTAKLALKLALIWRRVRKSESH